MKVLFIDTVHAVLWNKLSKKNFTCIDGTSLNYREIIEQIKQVEGLVIRSKFTLDKQILTEAKKLKFIARSGSGLENIDVKLAKELGIKVFDSPEGNRNAVAEHALGMLLSLFNHLIKGDAEVKNGVWKREENRGVELDGKTIGLIGFGNTGQAFAKKLSGFDCDILAFDIEQKTTSDLKVQQTSLTEIKQKADIISFHVPYNTETHYYFNHQFLNEVKKPFYLINTSRGKVVNTQTLIDGLKSNIILGACIDVLEFESNSFETIDEKFKDALVFLKLCPNVILSPHVAGWTNESYYKLSDVLAQKILAEFCPD